AAILRPRRIPPSPFTETRRGRLTFIPEDHPENAHPFDRTPEPDLTREGTRAVRDSHPQLMQADLRSIIETLEGKLVGEELLHDTVDMAFTGNDPNELTDDFTNILLVTNLVHTRLMQVAEEVDIV